MAKIIFTEDQIKLVRKMYEDEKLTIATVANFFDVSYSWLSFRMGDWGIPKRRKWAKKWRRCRGCNNHFRVNKENFYTLKDYLCKSCAQRKQLHIRREKEFGINPDEYILLLDRQDGVCAICGNAPDNKQLAVDHCHKIGKVRGLLCQYCNTGIGLFKEDPEILAKAIDYLQRL